MTVVTTDDINGFIYLGASETDIIAPGVTISNSGGHAISSTFNQSNLFNFGSILASGINANFGVNFTGDSGVIFNAQGASIAGYDGIELMGAHARVTNEGSIVGTFADGIFAHGDDSVVVNHGHIFGTHFGVNETSPVGGGLIDNSGQIEGNIAGVRINTAAGLTTEIANTGTIRGLTSSISTLKGGFSLVNEGILIGGVDASGAGTDTDTIVNTGKIKGMVHLGGGDDVFIGAGGSSGAVFGEAGVDRLAGGAGADRLDGGIGNDTLTGGASSDHFVFSTALVGPGNVDRITDFKGHVDKVDLDHLIFTGAGANGVLATPAFYKGAHAHDANDRIIYNPANGALIYDSNGNAAGGEVKFAVLAAHLALTHSDFLIV